MEPELKKAIVDDLHRFDKCTMNQSILMIGDIDCSFGLLSRGDFLEDEAGMSRVVKLLEQRDKQDNKAKVEGGNGTVESLGDNKIQKIQS
ncbi:hypothetical protein Ancab_003241 [Ancistrocladus abbreviatus]